jgi:hypothetical protein
MARRIFISFQHQDQMRAKGFNLLRWNRNVDVEFVGRHLLDPVDSTNEAYVRQCIREQLTGTSVTVILVGPKTHDSEWVGWEIEQSLAKEVPNGLLAIQLPGGAPLPPQSPVGAALRDAGAEVIGWTPHEFADAIERAARAAGRAQVIRHGGSSSGGQCGR